MTVLSGETMCCRVMMKSFVIQNAACSERQALFELLLAKVDPGGIVQTGNHESPVIDAHPLNRRLVFVPRMVVRHAVGIDGRALEERRVIGTGDVRPDKFIKQDHADTESLNLGYGGF